MDQNLSTLLSLLRHEARVLTLSLEYRVSFPFSLSPSPTELWRDITHRSVPVTFQVCFDSHERDLCRDFDETNKINDLQETFAIIFHNVISDEKNE
jgi:hypothetical protein